MEQANDDTVNFIFVRNLYADTTIQAKKNEILSDVIERYQKKTNINCNDYYYSYNNQNLDLNSYVKDLTISDNKAYIDVVKNPSDSILMSRNAELSYSVLNQTPIEFNDSGNTTSIIVDNMSSFLYAMNEYELLTNSKGQNEYYLGGGHKIDPDKSPEENGVVFTSPIFVKKKDDTLNILQNNNVIGVTLIFKKKYFQDIEIQVKYDDLVKIAIDRYLGKLQYQYVNNKQLIKNKKYNFLFMEKKLNEFQTILQSGLKDRSEIKVEENNNKLINVVFSRDFQRITIQANVDDTVGEIIHKYIEKSNLVEYSGYMYIFNVKILNDYNKTLREEGIVKDCAEINVVPPEVIGA